MPRGIRRITCTIVHSYEYTYQYLQYCHSNLLFKTCALFFDVYFIYFISSIILYNE